MAAMAALPSALPSVAVWLTLPAGGVIYVASLLALGTFRGDDWQPIRDALPKLPFRGRVAYER